jgi:hypothetical protein
MPEVKSGRQAVPAAEQNRLTERYLQQGWFAAPHWPQLPVASQAPTPAQLWPTATHTVTPSSEREQQPLAHRLPGQQGPPGAPQLRQVPVREPVTGMQAESASVHGGLDGKRQQALSIFPHTH